MLPAAVANRVHMRWVEGPLPFVIVRIAVTPPAALGGPPNRSGEPPGSESAYGETTLPSLPGFTTATRTELGLWFDRSVLLNPDAALTLRARAAWAHDFDDERDIAASFQTLPLASFTVFGASPAQDYALLSGAAELRLRNGWSFALKGDAELAGRTQTLSGNGTLKYAW